MTGELPLISVLMPSYGHEVFVAEAIESVLHQTYPNVELIVVDDCSRDKTFQIAQKIAKGHPQRVRLFQNSTNMGVTRTLNRAAAESAGSWVGILASDDKYASNYLKSQFDFAMKNPEVALVHSDGYFIDESGRCGPGIYERSKLPPLQGDDAFDRLILGEARIVACTLFFKREVFDRVGLFDESLVSEDFDFHLRALREFKIAFNSERIFFARETPGSLGKSPRKYADDGLKIIEKHRDRLGATTEDVMVAKLLRNSEMGFYANDFSLGVEQAWAAFWTAQEIRRRVEVVARTGNHAARFMAKGLLARIRRDPS